MATVDHGNASTRAVLKNCSTTTHPCIIGVPEREIPAFDKHDVHLAIVTRGQANFHIPPGREWKDPGGGMMKEIMAKDEITHVRAEKDAMDHFKIPASDRFAHDDFIHEKSPVKFKFSGFRAPMRNGILKDVTSAHGAAESLLGMDPEAFEEEQKALRERASAGDRLGVHNKELADRVAHQEKEIEALKVQLGLVNAGKGKGK